jgi:hypothetical protein
VPRLRVFLLISLGLVVCANSMMAASYVVGLCKPTLPNYPTISAAVSGVPPGSTVLVCPGIYSEQIIISQPLTLQGIVSANSGQVVITVPVSGLTGTTDIYNNPVEAQLQVTAGPVNISNITLDGTGGDNVNFVYLIGVYYQTGSSGTVNEAATRNQICQSCFNFYGGGGVGIWAENGSSTSESVTIENSSIHDANYAGLVVVSNPPPTLTVTIKGNDVEDSGYFAGISLQNVAGTVTNNIISGPIGGNGNLARNVGIDDSSPSSTVSGNTMVNLPFGIRADQAGVTITSNKIWNSNGAGIFLVASGAIVQLNTITRANVGIDFFCQTGTVARNTINEATTAGIAEVPSSFTGVNTFFNVGTIRSSGSCP